MSIDLGVAIIGAGSIGNKRAQALQRCGIGVVAAVADVDLGRAAALVSRHGGQAYQCWRDAIAHPDVDVVIASTSNDGLRDIAVAALQSGKHVLCEKPLGRNAAEAAEMVAAADKAARVLKTGFNHRYHPAIREAQRAAAMGAIGPLYAVRCRYGHGGRPGYDLEWRTQPEISGGGELLDQGVHAIDLASWFLGPFTEAVGFTSQFYWKGGGDVEDNAFALLRTATGQVAQVHASWTQWKNLFSFEVVGRDGMLVVDGLGGSYGVERLITYQRRPESGPPEQTIQEFPGPDASWDEEWRDFCEAIASGRIPLGSGQDGLAAMRAITAIYKSAKERVVVQL